MRTTVLLLAAAALAAAAFLAPAPHAAADPFTGNFDPLLEELNARDESLPTSGLTKPEKKARAALRKCFKALEANSNSIGGDLKMAGKMIAALARGFPEDEDFAPILDTLADDLGTEVGILRDDLEVAIALALPGGLREKAQAKLDAADVALAEAVAEVDPAQHVKLLKSVVALTKKGMKLALRAQDGGAGGDSYLAATVDGDAWQSNDDFGTAVTGFATVSDSTSGVRKLVFSGRRILASTGDDHRLPGDSTKLQITLTAQGTDIVPGTYAIGNGNEVAAAASWLFEPETGPTDFQIAIAGSVTLTTVTVTTASVSVSGTFTLTMTDGDPEVTFEIEGGLFQVLGLPRNQVP